ncbi:MAG: hypothetical protein ACTSWQ_08815, partial [Candidatus Thorarchaeota archaeon]
MTAAPKDLGKAHVRVRLYDHPPGVRIVAGQLRQSYSLALSFGGDEQLKGGQFNTQTIALNVPNGPRLSAALMPVPILEPVDNFMLTDATAPSAYTTDVYWKKIRFTGFPKFIQKIIKEQNPDAETTDKQLWQSEKRAIAPLKYSEDEYRDSAIPYDKDLLQFYAPAPGTTSDDEEKEEKDDEEEEAEETIPVDDVNSNSFVYQREGETGTWWAVKSNTFRGNDFGCWVIVQPGDINLKQSEKRSLLAIVLGKSFGASSADPSYAIKAPTLFIDNHGDVRIVYGFRTGSSTGTTMQSREVNLPRLPAMLREGEEIRIGFFTCMGRLVVFLAPNEYDTVSFTDKK